MKRGARLVLVALVAASPACKRREPRLDAAAPSPVDARRDPAPPGKAEGPLPACDKNPVLARSLEKLLKVKPNEWGARPGRFPDPACAVVAVAGENCLETPDETDDAAMVPRRLVGVMDPVTGALRAGKVEELSGLGEACFSSESISAVLDLDGDGTDELVTRASSSHHAENLDSATVLQVRKKRVSRVGWIPISYDAVGRGDEEPEPSCVGSLSVIPAGAEGGPALELKASLDGKGELTEDQCLPGHRRFRLAGGKLAGTKVAAKSTSQK